MTKISLYFSKSNSCGPLERSSYKPAKKILREARKIFAQSLKKKNTINFGILFFPQKFPRTRQIQFQQTFREKFCQRAVLFQLLVQNFREKKFRSKCYFCKDSFREAHCSFANTAKKFSREGKFFSFIAGH